MIKIDKNGINLKQTLLSGQAFRIKYENGTYTLILSDRVVSITEQNDVLLVESSNENDLKNVIETYLDTFETSYSLFSEEDDIIKSSEGYRILKQDKFEMFISYIISQNNNIKRITKIIDELSKKFGQKIIFKNNEYYLFPKKEILLNITLEDLSEFKLGFRDKYVMNALNILKTNSTFLEDLDKFETDKCINELMSIKGIGLKVSSCILLFAYHRFDSYPIDTWVKKYMKDNYGLDNINEIKRFIRNKYNNNFGLYIQYIYNFNRNIIDKE